MTGAAMDGDQALPDKGKQKGGLFRTSTLRTQDLIAEVKPHWQKLSDAERQKLLTIPEALAYSRARDGPQNSKPKGNKAETKAHQQEIFAQFLRSWDNLQEGLPMYLWRLEGDPDDDKYISVEDFWEDLECETNEEELFDTLPKLSRGGSIDRHASKQLYKFLCDLSEKIYHAQTQKVAEMMRSRFPRMSGEIALLCENAQIELIKLILKELQGSYPILYQNIQARMEKAINNDRLANGKSATHFSVQKAHTILRQLQTGALKRLGEWLIMKVDEFKLLAQGLEEGGGAENSKETYVLVSDPIKEDKAPRHFTVDTQWLEHLKVSKIDTVRGSEEAHDSQLDETGLQLEWLFAAVVSNPETARQQAKRSPGLLPYTLEDARVALMDAMNAQRECQVARESARVVALGILQHRKDLQEFLKKYPDMYTVRQGDDEGNEDDREVPDDVLLFMLSRELHLCSAKIIINNTSSARAASNFVAFIEHIEEITHQTNKLDWETMRDQYCEPDESFNCFDEDPEQRLEEHQAEEIAEEQENHSLPHEVEPKTTAVSKVYLKKRVSAEQSERLTLHLWADWVLNQRDSLKMLMHTEAQSGRGTDKKEVADLSDSTEAAAATAEVPQEPLPPLTKVTPKQEEWRRILRKRFNKMARPKLLSDKADKELLAELSKEIKAIELLLESGKASLQLLEKHFENVAFHDLHDELSCVILPLLRERVLAWARLKSESFASQAKRDLLHEEQVRVKKKKEKEAKKAKAKERKLEKHAAFKAAGKENMPPEEGEGAEEALPEEPTAQSWWAQEPRTNLIQEEQKAKSENGDMSWLLGDADELDYKPSSDFIGSQNAFQVVQKKTRRSKENISSRGQHCPSTGNGDCDNPQEAALVLPLPMPSSQTSSKKLVRPRPPPV